MTRLNRNRLLAAVCAAAVVACAHTSAPALHAGPDTQLAPPPDDTTKLVVIFTIDQFRGDYYERHRSQMRGGLRRLFEASANFTRAYHDHANTETAPGHATLLSGRFPRHTGIISNNLGVPDSQAPLVGGRGPGASPFRFRGSTLIDWMRLKDQRSRALSVAGKDRSAILPLGRAQQDVYWYNHESGTYVTSTYYRDTLPDWVRVFNARGLPQSYAGSTWTLFADVSAYPEPDSVSIEAEGRNVTFPHRLPVDPAAAAAELRYTPWTDEITLALALEGVRAMRLGSGPATDLLAISLSATDRIGHRYGPESRELHDQLLRVDHAIGTFLDSLFRIVDSSRLIIALSADHGVTPFPGTAPEAKGATVDFRELGRRIRTDLTNRGVAGEAVRLENDMLFLDRFALRRARVDADSFIASLAAELRRHPNVERVHTRRDLPRDSASDVSARRWAHAIPSDLPVELMVTLRPYDLWAPLRTAQHGSPHDYDAHVPLLLWGRPFKPARIDRIVRTVDLAPTLAWALGVQPTEPLDGRVLRDALRAP